MTLTHDSFEYSMSGFAIVAKADDSVSSGSEMNVVFDA